MEAKKIRETFFEFFRSKEHLIVSSAPIVSKNDPTLLFTNAGMNQFKDFFLGHKKPKAARIADTQKCLRVSGKHNDLEEVGIDSYHHTMFEMLGNWSFGDYFKNEAIAWAWELLTGWLKLNKEDLYATVFEGDTAENLDPDEEAAQLWQRFLPKDRILYFGKKDNFWEMGDTGPCGPCSEIHIDLRSASEKKKVPGNKLVNKDHPQVVEIWNLVFIQFNRKSNGNLEDLPEKHVDTGMGFERLCMALQGKKSNYDTDLFTPFITFIETQSGKKYSGSYQPDAKVDIAMRVISDHIRAVCFTIADGAMPSNTGAGYVVRRILRRAVRYYFSFLDIKEPFLFKMVSMVADYFAEIFPELIKQEDFVTKVILEEERSFLRTLDLGLKRLEQVKADGGIIDGKIAFELYDTYGFPIDLTRLVVAEKGLEIDEKGFTLALDAQRNRSKADAVKKVGDWVTLDANSDTEFIGYDQLVVENARVLKYRQVHLKGKDQYQIVLDKTPFYAEAGGQIGDQGKLVFNDETIRVKNTVKENDLIIHILEKWPTDLDGSVRGEVDCQRRKLIENNHSATHLMHAALRKVLGGHVAQKGSLVSDRHLRFDFSHYQKMSDEEIRKVENLVNSKIRQNIARGEYRSIPIEQAKESGAMMLFGEKYGDEVRMITFDPDYSVELCGGCHVPSTGRIGYFKIISESAIAAGVRRIEAITAVASEEFINSELDELKEIRQAFKNPQNALDQVLGLVDENKQLRKEIEKLANAQLAGMKEQLKASVEKIHGISFIASKIKVKDSKALKNLSYQIEKELGNAFIVFGAEFNGKPQLMITISEQLTKENGLHAGNIIREIAKEIKGGGGGQSFFATAGGKDSNGIEKALENKKENYSKTRETPL